MKKGRVGDKIRKGGREERIKKGKREIILEREAKPHEALFTVDNNKTAIDSFDFLQTLFFK